MLIPVTLYNYFDCIVVDKNEFGKLNIDENTHIPIRLLRMDGIPEIYDNNMSKNIFVIEYYTVAWLIIPRLSYYDIIESDICQVYDDEFSIQMQCVSCGDLQLSGKIIDRESLKRDYLTELDIIFKQTIGILIMNDLSFNIFYMPSRENNYWTTYCGGQSEKNTILDYINLDGYKDIWET